MGSKPRWNASFSGLILRSDPRPGWVTPPQDAVGPGAFDVELDMPAHGVAPGQAAVFYDGDVVLGGGWID